MPLEELKMADIASTDVTITIQKNRILKGSPGSQQRNLVKIQFGNGALTYPANGVPMPSFPSFGMRRELEYLVMLDSGSGVTTRWVYDVANKKIRGWVDDGTSGISAEVTGAVAAQTLYAEAVGW
jgi:hypothetical protein